MIRVRRNYEMLVSFIIIPIVFFGIASWIAINMFKFDYIDPVLLYLTLYITLSGFEALLLSLTILKHSTRKVIISDQGVRSSLFNKFQINQINWSDIVEIKYQKEELYFMKKLPKQLNGSEVIKMYSAIGVKFDERILNFVRSKTDLKIIDLPKRFNQDNDVDKSE